MRRAVGAAAVADCKSDFVCWLALGGRAVVEVAPVLWRRLLFTRCRAYDGRPMPAAPRDPIDKLNDVPFPALPTAPGRHLLCCVL